MSELLRRVQRLEAALSAAEPEPYPPVLITAETVGSLSAETVERIMWWLSLRFQVFKPGTDEIRRSFIHLFYQGTRGHPDPAVVEGWRLLYVEEEAAWAKEATRH